MQERVAVRVTPRNPVTVAIEAEDQPLAYGVVANISASGACLWTSGAFAVGEGLVVRLSFPDEPQPLQAAGRVVWEDAQRNAKGAMRLGLAWSHTVGPAHLHLQGLIAAAA